MSVQTEPMTINLGPQHPSTHGVFRFRVTFDGEVVGPDEDETRIPSSDLLENPRDNNTCSACGQSRWWTKQCGQRMCAVCHPGPSGTHVDDIK